MKNLFKTACLVLLISLPSLMEAQIGRINVPNDLLLSSQPTSGNSMTYNAVFEKGSCIQMFAANPNAKARKINPNSGKVKMTRSQRSSSMAIVNLQSCDSGDDSITFNFGLECGENQTDDANVHIAYARDETTGQALTGGNTPVRLDIEGAEVLSVSENNLPDDGALSEDFLRINADNNATATISIDRNTEQGQVIVGIFRVQGNPNPIALLDPKAETDQRVVVNHDVFVVPIIRPKLRIIDGIRTIIFEVGDPEENGRVEIDEEE